MKAVLQCLFASFFIALVLGENDEKELDFYDLKCSACCSMVAELERNLETEKPRMNVDLRKTLTGSQDQGKNIDYAVSELRTFDVLESLCPGMRNYGVAHQTDGTATYQRYNVNGGSVRIGGSLTLGGDKHRVDQTRLESFCYALVEEHEDVLSEAIRSAGLAKKAKDEEMNRRAKAKRRGEVVEEIDPFQVLDININDDAYSKLDETEKLAYVKKIYRKLSKKYHPDKNKGDVDSVKKFVNVAKAYETISGDELSTYGNLYRELCLDMAGICSNEEEIEKIKFYFPRYMDSEKFGNSAGGGLDEPKVKEKLKLKDKKKKKSKKKKKGTSEKTEL